MSSIPSSLPPTTLTTIDGGPAPTTAALIADLQKMKNELPGKYTASDIIITLRSIAKMMAACAASFPEVTIMRDPISFRVSPTRNGVIFEKTCETPSRLVSKVKLINLENSSESEAIVVVNAHKIHIFSLNTDLLHFQIKFWLIGGVSSREDGCSNSSRDSFLEVFPVTGIYSPSMLCTMDAKEIDTASKIMQSFITHITAANEFLTQKGIEKARFPSFRSELLARMIDLLAIGLSKDPSTIVVSYVKNDLVKPSALGLPYDPEVPVGIESEENLMDEVD